MHVFMNWFTNHAFGSHAAEWLAVVILLALAFCIGTLKFVSSLLTHERDAAESEKDYWRIHGGEWNGFDALPGEKPGIHFWYTFPATSIPLTLAQFVQKCPWIPSCVTEGGLLLHTLLFRKGCALRATVSFWPSSCKRNVRARRSTD